MKKNNVYLPINLSVTIRFTVDKETIEAAIRQLLLQKEKVSKTNIIQVIKEEVYTKGKSIIDFPELWGDDSITVDDDKVRDYLIKFLPKFGIFPKP